MFGACNTVKYMYVICSYTEHYEVEIDVIEMPWYNVCVQKV